MSEQFQDYVGMVLAQLGPDASEAARAEGLALTAQWEDVNDLAPLDMPHRPQAIAARPDEAVVRVARDKDEPGHDQVVSAVRGYRAQVTWYENENASRLRRALWVLGGLRQADQAKADKFEARIRQRYNIPLDTPLHTDRIERRKASTKLTRDYNALPREWREL